MSGTVGHLGKQRMRLMRAAVGFLSLLLIAVSPVKAARAGQEQVSKDFQKTVAVGAGQGIRVEHKFGEVKIHGEPGSEVKISAAIHAQADSRAEAESFAEAIQIEVEQTANGVSIRTVYPESSAAVTERTRLIPSITTSPCQRTRRYS